MTQRNQKPITWKIDIAAAAVVVVVLDEYRVKNERTLDTTIHITFVSSLRRAIIFVRNKLKTTIEE